MFHLDTESKFWVVRAGRSQRYYDFFKRESVITIGHWDSFLKAEGGLDLGSYPSFTQQYQVIRDIALPEGLDPDLRRKSQTKLRQGEKFYNELNTGDFIITFGSNNILIGIIQSDCEIVESRSAQSLFTPTHRLQRKVLWISEKDKRQAPSSLSKMISSPPLSVYSADDHADAIISWISPCHQTDKTLTLSTNINSRNDIGSVQKANLNLTICHLELLAGAISNTPHDQLLQDIEKRDLFELLSSSLTASEKAEYMSPGFTWSKIECSDPFKKGIIAAMFLILLNSKSMAEEIILDVAKLEPSKTASELLIEVESLAEAVSNRHNFKDTSTKLELTASKNPNFDQRPVIPKPISNPNNRVR